MKLTLLRLLSCFCCCFQESKQPIVGDYAKLHQGFVLPSEEKTSRTGVSKKITGYPEPEIRSWIDDVAPVVLRDPTCADCYTPQQKGGQFGDQNGGFLYSKLGGKRSSFPPTF